MATHEPSGTILPGLVDEKPVIIGLYGLPGSGKTHTIKNLTPALDKAGFKFYEGSEVIGKIASGGNDASVGLVNFKILDKHERNVLREHAINDIAKECKEGLQVGVVAGHFMFWKSGEQAGEVACTDSDLSIYTHVLYIDTPPETIFARSLEDKERTRDAVTIDHLRKWQQEEKDQLRQLCRENGILFSLVSTQGTKLNTASLVDKISTLLYDFQKHNEKYNMKHAEIQLDAALGACLSRPETVIVLDGDKTLAAQDTGFLFWKTVSDTPGSTGVLADPLKDLFGGPLKYSYTAFRQATLLYHETANEWEFDSLCQQVADKVTLHPEFVVLFQKVAELKHVGLIILTCGLRRVWEKVLKVLNLTTSIAVIGGGRITDGIVVTRAVKGHLVTQLRQKHQMYVWAFGDSPLDLDMLKAADQAVVVVGDEKTRSKSMGPELTTAVDNGLQARQLLLPNTVSPQIDVTKLPVVTMNDDFIDSVLRRRSPRIMLAQDRSSAKLLMTPARNSDINGPALRKAHRHVGWYLATEFVSDAIGLEKFPLPHALGRRTTGFRLCHEKQTLIVALMRGGEPMAMGVSKAFPEAMVAHAKAPDEIKPQNIQKARAIILVDSVINTGKSVVEFVEYIRKEHADLLVVMVAHVVQDQSIVHGKLARLLEDDIKLNLVALRLSATSYVGSRATDTGNRLFNTTHLD